MKNSRSANSIHTRSGFALISVLFVLIALLILCAPFLGTATNTNEAGVQMAEAAQLRLAQDGAARHARALLGASHPTLDTTLDWDSIEELAVDLQFDPAFLNPHDAQGVMWDLEVGDQASLIDLNSAGPHMLANVLGLATMLVDVVEAKDLEVKVASTSGFGPEGYLWIDGELIHYAAIEGSTFVRCTRGLGARYDDEGRVLPGPLPPLQHPLGAPVLDQRAFALPLWRLSGPEERERLFDASEQVLEAEEFLIAGAEEERGRFEGDEVERLTRLGSVYAGVTGGRRWQHPARLTTPVSAHETMRIGVSEMRWFGVGSTIRIQDERGSEFAIVTGIANQELLLDRLLEYDYSAYSAEVSVLAKRPVNLNTASVEVLRALFLNLKLRGRNARILAAQANQLAALVVSQRPFDGMQDFLERLVLPAAGIAPLPEQAKGESIEPFLQPPDAVALYANGLNANDILLEFSTMPYAFVSREVYDIELRASVNAASGVQRTSGVRERVELITPQRELFYLWSRQADFDESLRLDNEAPWWMTGPEATSRFDGSTVPPSRLTPHFGTIAGTSLLSSIFDPTLRLEGEGTTLEHVFADREDEGYCQLWPARVSEEGPLAEGRLLHFDHETRDPEGRYLPDEVLRLDASDRMVRWTAADDPLLKSFSFSAWVKPRTLEEGTLLEVGGADGEVDRVTLKIEGSDLVLRVIDGFGDHRFTPEREVGELRLELATGAGPGLPIDVWSHIAVDVRGNKPSQMSLLVNGLAYGVRTSGLTRLAGAMSQNSETVLVESTEGFPDRGVARVGNELVEYVRESETSLRCVREETGPYAGFGGRLARSRIDEAGLPIDLARTEVSHPAGTPVEVYGYSLPLVSNLPAGGAILRDPLGIWRVARITGVDGEGIPATGDTVIVGFVFLGNGIEGAQRRPPPFDLLLAQGDAPLAGDNEFMEGFQRSGGLAAIVQVDVTVVGTDNRTSFGVPIMGIEVVRYSGWSENRLHIVERADVTSPQLQRWRELTNETGAAEFATDVGRAFVFQWNDALVFQDGSTPQSRMNMGCYIFPISLTAGSTGTFTGFLDPIAQSSPNAEHAQITHLTDAENTEWVRYDEIVRGELVRSSPAALRDARNAITGGGRIDYTPPPDDDGGGFWNEGGGDTNGPTPPPPPSASSQQQSQSGSQWLPTLGAPDDKDFPLTRAVREALRFRGVMGTYSHKHEAGLELLPVFRVRDATVFSAGADQNLLLSPEHALHMGLPGRGDAVFVAGSEVNHIGWPLQVHRAYRPFWNISVTSWRQEGEDQQALPVEGSTVVSENDIFVLETHVALQQACPEPIAGLFAEQGSVLSGDSRLYSRLSKFPSGERPRVVQGVGIGTSTVQSSNPTTGAGASVPSALIDEIHFGDSSFALGIDGLSPANASAGAGICLSTAMTAESGSFQVLPNSYYVSLGLRATAELLLDDLPADAGLLRLGSEILAYSSRDPSVGNFTVAINGRGLLGSTEEAHQRGEIAFYLESHTVTTLAANVSAGDAQLPLSDLTGFPSQGTVLIGEELIHYTHIEGGAIAMPRASSEAGARDGKGPGIFRGRFGTVAAGHAANEVVILFPFRYWDRWTPLVDAPELGYFGFQMHQPGAFWRSFFWDGEEAPTAGVRLGVMTRANPDVPWDSEPNEGEGLWLSYEGREDDRELPLEVRADQVEWRVFAQYDPFAFDPRTGLSHAWKTTPRFRRLGVSYIAPSRVLRSVDR